MGIPKKFKIMELVGNKEITIAVLPFRVHAPDQALSPVIMGFTEDLIVNFSKFIGLSVISQYSTQHIQDISDDKMIALLGADYLITGSFRSRANGLRIGVQLIRVKDKKVVFAGNHDESLEAVLNAQDMITQQIVSVLQQQIDYDLLSYSYKKESVELAAYENWLVGMNLLKKGSLESDLEARRHFEEALRINPHFARAYSGISLSYFNEWSCQLWDRWDVSQKGAHTFALKAIEYDEHDYVSLAVLGRTFLYLGEYDKSEFYLRKSLQMNPNDADNLVMIAFCLVYLGFVDEAEKLYLKAKLLNPLHPEAYFPHGSFIYFEKGDFKKSAELGEMVRDDSIWTDFTAFLAAAYFHLNDLGKMASCWKIYKGYFSKNIQNGGPVTDRQALEWQIMVNPFKVKSRLEPFWEYLGKGHLPVQPAHVKREKLTSASILRKNNLWEFSFEGKTILLPDSKGIHDIRKLLAFPEQEIHCVELMGGRIRESSSPETIDQKAKRSYQARIRQLQADIREAEEFGNTDELQKMREEYDALLDHLSGALGLSGRPRKIGSPAEKARAAVTWRIRSSIGKIEPEHSQLARHFKASIKTGTYCAYRPENRIEWLL
jgi:TolB-like protein